MPLVVGRVESVTDPSFPASIVGPRVVAGERAVEQTSQRLDHFWPRSWDKRAVIDRAQGRLELLVRRRLPHHAPPDFETITGSGPCCKHLLSACIVWVRLEKLVWRASCSVCRLAPWSSSFRWRSPGRCPARYHARHPHSGTGGAGSYSAEPLRRCPRRALARRGPIASPGAEPL